jgi:hypothetical protein
MAKVQIKSEKITALVEYFSFLDKFDSILSSVIDSHLGHYYLHLVIRKWGEGHQDCGEIILW